MPTPFVACPTEIAEAPIDVVWKLLTDFAGWDTNQPHKARTNDCVALSIRVAYATTRRSSLVDGTNPF
jgi:hypothetical protein